MSLHHRLFKLWKNTIKSWYRQTYSKSKTKVIFPVLFGKVFQLMEENRNFYSADLRVQDYRCLAYWRVKDPVKSREKRGLQDCNNIHWIYCNWTLCSICQYWAIGHKYWSCKGIQRTTTSQNEQTPKPSKDYETLTEFTSTNDRSESGIPLPPMSPNAATQSDCLVTDPASKNERHWAQLQICFQKLLKII